MQLAPLYPILYRFLKPMFPHCLWSGSGRSRKIALTFDDGPHRDHTLPLLEVLASHQVKGNFFWLGECVERNPQIAKTVYEEGHYIGLHGYQHQNFPSLSQEQLRESLLKTQTAIAQSCNIAGEKLRDVRPPNGLFTPQVLQQLTAQQYRVVMWSVVPEDWCQPGVEVVLSRTLEQVTNGSVIVLHDGYYGGKDVSKITAQLIPELVQLGYELVTIEELWQDYQGEDRN